MGDIVIDIPDDLEADIPEDVCIYKIPTPIRMVREKAYTPQVVSIGLIHWNNRDENMELQKKRYLKEFCGRLAKHSEEEQNDFKRQLADEISRKREKIINCYEKRPNIEKDDELVKMILLDAVFIMELFLRSLHLGKYEKDFIIARPWLRGAVQKDLLLLENQLPFYILDELYTLSCSKFEKKDKLTFRQLTCKYFSACGPRGRAAANIEEEEKILHFTDVVRHFWLRGHPSPQNQDLPQNQILPTAMDLHDQAGVKFRVLENALLLDVTFKEKNYLIRKVGELRMPYIIIDGATERIIRNVMALEQCHYPKKAYVCNYITLLDHLINTDEDVNLLVEAKIIRHRFGDNALMANMINELCRQTVEDANCYSREFQELNNFYRSKCNRRWATLKRVYFKDMWTTTATLVAALLVILQIAQTFSSIWQITH